MSSKEQNTRNQKKQPVSTSYNGHKGNSNDHCKPSETKAEVPGLTVFRVLNYYLKCDGEVSFSQPVVHLHDQSFLQYPWNANLSNTTWQVNTENLSGNLSVIIYTVNLCLLTDLQCQKLSINNFIGSLSQARSISLQNIHQNKSLLIIFYTLSNHYSMKLSFFLQPDCITSLVLATSNLAYCILRLPLKTGIVRELL